MFRSNPFHLIDNSPWPIIGSFSFFFFVSSALFFFLNSFYLFFFSFFFIMFLSFFWWRDVTRESTFLSFHSLPVQKNLLLSMIWFILSEVFFFFSFFWSFFHSSLSASIDLFNLWPPFSVEVLNPLSVPLLNTVVLLSSSITVTWSHYNLFSFSFFKSFCSLMLTIFLSGFFSFLQYTEYLDSSFSISDSVYGSIFFMMTSFHSFHVFISSLFLMVSFIRLGKSHFNPYQHISMECSIWYWHFVDVVWILLYLMVYWWGSFFYIK